MSGSQQQPNDQQEVVVIRGGWSTSICDLFRNPLRRENCCALACCGMLLSDRNAHFMLNEARPSWVKRLGINIGLPVVIFLVLNICYTYLANTNEEEDLWQIGIFYTILLLVSFLLWRAKSERIKIRREVMKRIYQQRFLTTGGGETALSTEEQAMIVAATGNNIDTLDPADQANIEVYLETHMYDNDVAHSTLGFYTKDIITTQGGNALQQQHQQQHQQDENPQKGDLCTCIFDCLSKIFFGACCCCWLQCCGMCAIGQEAREIETLLDKKALQVDYITFQPYSEYYPRILELRQTNNRKLWAHWHAISTLSQNLLKIVIAGFLVLSLIAILEFDPDFKLENMIVVLATFVQAVTVLFFVHWFENRMDISVDAVIKYFASGFCLCSFIAIMYEMILSMVFGATSQIIIAIGIRNQVNDVMTEEEIEAQMEAWGFNHVPFMIFFIFLNAFVVAGFVEEIAKYFGYMMVETPDLMNPQEIAFLQEEVLRKKEKQAEQTAAGEATTEKKEPNIYDVTNTSWNLTSRASGITVAMVAVAAGFACCENLLYVFVYTEPGVLNEVSTLIVRSIFPVHPICAAIQSIGVVNRDILGDAKSQLGWILLPALLIHGGFDFALMVMSFMDDMQDFNNGINEEDRPQEDEFMKMEEGDEMDLYISVGIVVIGLFYFACLADRQRRHLEELDAALAAAARGDSIHEEGYGNVHHGGGEESSEGKEAQEGGGNKQEEEEVGEIV